MAARRTYIYKLTSDRGGAPCAPDPGPVEPALLTLSICKPAIRRTAQPGDRLLGLTSHSLATTDGYPLNAVIYAAIVEDGLDAREYYGGQRVFQHRPDCIYQFHGKTGPSSTPGERRCMPTLPTCGETSGSTPSTRTAERFLAAISATSDTKRCRFPRALPSCAWSPSHWGRDTGLSILTVSTGSLTHCFDCSGRSPRGSPPPSSPTKPTAMRPERRYRVPLVEHPFRRD